MQVKNKIITNLSYLRTSWKRKLISISKTFNHQYGIEIGGPSPIVFGLKSIFPVYVFAREIDGINFSTDTVWEGKIEAGKTYKYFQNHCGYQYICEASDLSGIQDSKYDFALSSHSLEHIANPIKALLEWNRVLKKSGKLVLILPDKTRTFDSLRNYTDYKHLIEDFRNNTTEHDQTHMNEILELHNYTNDPGSNKTSFRDSLSNNFIHRMAHHHVFSLELIKQILDFAGFKTVYQQACPPFHLATIAEKFK